MKITGTPPTAAFAGPVAVAENTPELVFVQVHVTAPAALQIWPTVFAQPKPGVPDTTGVFGTPVVGVAVRVGVAVMVGVAVGATMLTVTVEFVAPGIDAWLVAVLGTVAVVLTRKFRTVCPPGAGQVTAPTKPAPAVAGTQLSPVWKTRPACHWSVNVAGP